MVRRSSHLLLRIPSLALMCLAFASLGHISLAQAQGTKQSPRVNNVVDSDGDHVQERNRWFFRGRLVKGKNSADLRRRAYLEKIKMRAQRAAAIKAARSASGLKAPVSLS